jgi:hypothetical protein
LIEILSYWMFGLRVEWNLGKCDKAIGTQLWWEGVKKSARDKMSFDSEFHRNILFHLHCARCTVPLTIVWLIGPVFIGPVDHHSINQSCAYWTQWPSLVDQLVLLDWYSWPSAPETTQWWFWFGCEWQCQTYITHKTEKKSFMALLEIL